MTYTYDVDDFLTHYGVKGMRWGHRKADDESSSGRQRTPEEKARQKARVRNVAIAAGALAVVAGSSFVAYSLYKNGKLPIGNLKRPSSGSKKAVESVLAKQTDILHATRGRNVGYTFVRTGGLPNPVAEFKKSGLLDDNSREFFNPFDSGDGIKIAARFVNPDQKKDFAGRLIPNELIIPASMTKGINSLDDVKEKIWPLIKAEFEDLYIQPGSVERNGK